jgi:penicillin-binding protein 2
VRQNRKRIIAEEPSVPGDNLILAIDLDLQKRAEEALKRSLHAARQTRGSVIVMQPKTGEVLALVSLPAFDNNAFAKGIDQETYAKLLADKDRPLFPRAIAASLPSGSTFKPAIAAAALEEHVVTPATTVHSTGGISYGAWFFPDWKPGGHGTTDVRKAIAESVNTFFYAVGGGYDKIKGLGPERIATYARKFGFGEQSGIDLPSEGAGFVPTPEWKKQAKGEQWYIGDTYHLAIGQGDLLVTPLQIAEMTAVFANGGSLVRPHVVSAVAKADGTRVDRQPEIITKQVVSPETIKVVREGMRRTVEAGSARSFNTLPIEVAAKTGTAQWKSGAPTHAWFTSFAPFADPELVITVSVEEGGEGSSIAAPVAKDLYAWYYGGRKDAVTTWPPPNPAPAADTNAALGAPGE